MHLTIYHNPRCTKSRLSLARLEAAGEKPEIIFYLKTGLSVTDIRKLIGLLGFHQARDLMRTGEVLYKKLNLADETDEAVLLAAMAAHPVLIERPVIVCGERAVIGRPPENVDIFL